MKSKLFYIAAILILFICFTKEKFFTIKFNEADLNKHWNKLTTIQQVLDESNLPHSVVRYAVSAIDSLKLDIQTQVAVQLKADTTVKPKPK